MKERRAEVGERREEEKAKERTGNMGTRGEDRVKERMAKVV